MPLGFPGGSVIKTLLADARDMGLIPDLGSLIPQAAEQLSLCATTTKPALYTPGPESTEARPLESALHDQGSHCGERPLHRN